MSGAHPSTPLMLEASVRAFIDEHMQTWLDNFVGRFASFERRYAALEHRFNQLDARAEAVEKVVPTLASADLVRDHGSTIEGLLVKLGGEHGIDAQLRDIDATIERIQKHMGGTGGLGDRLEFLEHALPTKADAQRVERIEVSISGEKSPQARVAKVERVLGDQIRGLADLVGRKVGRDELYFEMMARHMIAPPKSPAATRGHSSQPSRPFSFPR
mmetsp:Transcript_71624/g.213772  ORF Transcript_71624/g.213772 Transcript_71624/m.213772 type:complete len:215 (+) Transcript_71624:85-729(+)